MKKSVRIADYQYVMINRLSKKYDLPLEKLLRMIIQTGINEEEKNGIKLEAVPEPIVSKEAFEREKAGVETYLKSWYIKGELAYENAVSKMSPNHQKRYVKMIEDYLAKAQLINEE